MHRLAQQVLLQRSEVEAFLVSSIQLVRAEMAAEAAGTGAPAPAAAGPAGTGSMCTGQVSAAAGEGSSERAGQLEGAEFGAVPDSRGSTCADSNDPAGGCSAPEAAAGATQDSPTSCGAAGPTATVKAAVGAPAVDIRALSWQDRERVLRLLFAKINRAAAQVGFATGHGQGLHGAQARWLKNKFVPNPSLSSAPRHLQPVGRPSAEAAPLPPLRGLATEAGPAGLA